MISDFPFLQASSLLNKALSRSEIHHVNLLSITIYYNIRVMSYDNELPLLFCASELLHDQVINELEIGRAHV